MEPVIAQLMMILCAMSFSVLPVGRRRLVRRFVYVTPAGRYVPRIAPFVQAQLDCSRSYLPLKGGGRRPKVAGWGEMALRSSSTRAPPPAPPPAPTPPLPGGEG